MVDQRAYVFASAPTCLPISVRAITVVSNRADHNFKAVGRQGRRYVYAKTHLDQKYKFDLMLYLFYKDSKQPRGY